MFCEVMVLWIEGLQCDGHAMEGTPLCYRMSYVRDLSRCIFGGTMMLRAEVNCKKQTRNRAQCSLYQKPRSVQLVPGTWFLICDFGFSVRGDDFIDSKLRYHVFQGSATMLQYDALTVTVRVCYAALTYIL